MSEVKAIDAFEHWLQGRINLCVTGLQDQITNLQIANTELVKQVEQLEQGDARDMTQLLNEYFKNSNLCDVLDEYQLWDILEDKVKECVDEKLGEDDEELTEKIRSTVRDIDWVISAS